MLNWIKKRVGPPSPPHVADVLGALERLRSADQIEDVWDQMDRVQADVRDAVVKRVQEKSLPEAAYFSSVIWLAYLDGNRNRPLADFLAPLLEDAVVWALGFDENQVLIGGALGALDALDADAREAFALRVFERLGTDSVRRYWLLLKVRTEPFVRAVAGSMREFTDAERVKMAGAFRQFTPADRELLESVYTPEMKGAAFFEDALRTASRG